MEIMEVFKKKVVVFSVASGITLLFFIGLFFWWQKGSAKEEPTDLLDLLTTTSLTSPEKETTESSQTIIFVDIKGAVKKPGVYQLPLNARVFEGIKAAGGFEEEAAVEKVNQAKRLEDQSQLYVPKIGEEVFELNEGEDVETTTKNKEEKVNINEGDLSQLQQLPGIGAKKAEGIIQHREEHGKFKTIEALMEVSGIGEGTFTKLKDLITIR